MRYLIAAILIVLLSGVAHGQQIAVAPVVPRIAGPCFRCPPPVPTVVLPPVYTTPYPVYYNYAPVYQVIKPRILRRPLVVTYNQYYYYQPLWTVNYPTPVLYGY